MSLYDAGFSCSIKSSARTSGTISDFYAHCKVPDVPGLNKIAVTDLTVCKSWYMIQSGFNTFTLTELGVSGTITVPPGNYNRKSWMEVVPALLTAESKTLGHNWVYTADYPLVLHTADTGKITYTVTGNAGSQPTFTVTDYCYSQLGLDRKSSATFVGDSLQSPNVNIFQSAPSIYLGSDICDANDGNDIICFIFDAGNTADWNNIRYQAQHPTFSARHFKGGGNDSFRFTLKNGDGQNLIMNGGILEIGIKIFRDDSQAPQEQKKAP